MKKIFALALVVAMMLSMSVAAVAAVETLDVTNTNSSTPKEIVITNNKTNDTATKVYSVDVEWTDTEVDIDSTLGWNPVTHKYDIVKETVMGADNSASVRVTNHSNAVVNAEVTTDYAGSDFNIDCDDAVDLADASLVAPGAPTDFSKGNTNNFKITVSLKSGDLTLESDSFTFHATVTLTQK